MLVALNTMAQTQSNPPQHITKLCNDLLDYCATYPNVGHRYRKSDMILHIPSDDSYLVVQYDKSRITGFFQLTSNTSTPSHNMPVVIGRCKS